MRTLGTLLLLAAASTANAGEFRILNEKMPKGSWGYFDAQFSPDGKVLAAPRLQGTPVPRGRHRFSSQIILWDVESGERLHAGPMIPEKLQQVVFLPGGDRIATSRSLAGREVGFWSVADGGRSLKFRKPQFLREVGISATVKTTSDQIVTRLAVAPDGETLAAYVCYGLTGSESALRLWPKSGGSKAVSSRDPKDFYIHDLCFSQDSQQIISLVGQTGTGTGKKHNGFVLTIRSVDDPDKVTFRRHFDDLPDETGGLCAIPKTTWLAMGGDEGVLIFDLKTEKKVALLKTPVSFPVTELAVSRDGRFLAAGTQRGYGNSWIILWELGSRNILAQHHHACRDLEFSPDNRFLSVAGNQLALWDISAETGAPRTSRAK